MEYQVSARKYRPGNFDEVIGQPHVVQTLKNAVDNKRVAHAYVFSGMRGVGKTTVARILAKALNCEHGPTSQPCERCPSCEEITKGHSVDVIEIDGASNTGVDDVRELRENVKFTPFRGSYRVYIIDEVHMLSNSAFNALLKTLEEPPNHAVFVFATTEVHKIPATILSRCQHFTFRRMTRLEVIKQLKHVAQETGVVIEDRSLSAIGRACEGSMRDALSLLDQAVAFGGNHVRHEDLEALTGTVPEELVRSLVEAILKQDVQSGVSIVNQAIDQGYDVRVYCREIVEQMRNLMVAAVVPSKKQLQSLLELQQEDVESMMAQAQRIGEGPLQEWFEIFSRTENALRGSLHPRFVFEAAVIKATRSSTFNQGTNTRTEGSSASHTQPSVVSSPKGELSKENRPLQGLPVNPGHTEKPQKPLSDKTPKGINKSRPSTIRPKENSPKDKSPTRPAAVVSPNREVPPESSKKGDLDWESVMDRLIEHHPNIGRFLEMGTLVNVEPDQVIIGYQKSASVARWRTDKPENRTLVAKICGEVAGRPINVRVIELNDAQTAGPTIGQLRANRKEKQDQGLIDEVRAHPLVKQALELFGGDVVSARRVPPKEETS
jgi:DNA polymerase-3 subunit gamma/tau